MSKLLVRFFLSLPRAISFCCSLTEHAKNCMFGRYCIQMERLRMHFCLIFLFSYFLLFFFFFNAGYYRFDEAVEIRTVTTVTGNITGIHQQIHSIYKRNPTLEKRCAKIVFVYGWN